eukprot:2330924-Prymnesium_polylepis.1
MTPPCTRAIGGPILTGRGIDVSGRRVDALGARARARQHGRQLPVGGELLARRARREALFALLRRRRERVAGVVAGRRVDGAVVRRPSPGSRARVGGERVVLADGPRGRLDAEGAAQLLQRDA